MLALAGAATAQPAEPQPQPPPEPEPEFHLVPETLERFVEDFARDAPGLETIAKGTFRRARRAISIGPTVGFYGVARPHDSDLDGSVTFGLGLELFKVPVLPSPAMFHAMV